MRFFHFGNDVRKQLMADDPSLTFATVAPVVSSKWKEVELPDLRHRLLEQFLSHRRYSFGRSNPEVRDRVLQDSFDGRNLQRLRSSSELISFDIFAILQ